MTFVVSTKQLVVWIEQYQLRHVRPGQEAEIILKMFPGRTFKAKVASVAPLTRQGQEVPSGMAPVPPPRFPGAYGVLLEPDDRSVFDGQRVALGGAAGTAAVYTESGRMTHLIRRVMLRMETWVNFVNPY